MHVDGMSGEGYLSSGIDNLGSIFLVLVLDDLAESILDSRVVAFDKVAVNVLHRERGLACKDSLSMIDLGSAMQILVGRGLG